MLAMSPLRFSKVTKNGEEKEKMLSGVIIRHLVLPDLLQDSYDVLDWLKFHADGKACISLMTQYTPIKATAENESPNRFISEDEFSAITNEIEDYCFEHLFYQELIQDDSWLPDFNNIQPFSNKLAKPIWHWKNGFI